jgi:hypothetical protein
MQKLQFELRGTTPMLCHNGNLADPDNEITAQIAVINAKRKKTAEDRAEVARLEWYGGLYLDASIDGPVIPTANIRKTFNSAAKITREGKQIERGLTFADMAVPLVYDGPRDIDKLFERKEFVDRRMVVINRGRVPKTRPIFPNWSLVCTGYIMENMIDLDSLKRIVEVAGSVEGMNDNRANGFGRFEADIVVI